MSSSIKPKRKYLRIGLLELLLVMGAVAAWLPTWIAKSRIPELESQVQLYRSYTSELDRVDPSQLCLRRLRTVSKGMSAWKYYLPSGTDLELRFATEQISAIARPSQYDSVKLPEGEHRIYLREYNDTNEDYVKQVYVDDTLVLKSRHPSSWLNSSGSSYSNLPIRSEAYPLSEPLALRKARYADTPNLGNTNVYSRMPNEYDAKGCCLWIAPVDWVDEPAPNFHFSQNASDLGSLGKQTRHANW